jgi:two-component system NarL family response regulator
LNAIPNSHNLTRREGPAGAPVTVLCVDSHNLVRECVAAVLEQDPGLRVVAEARTVKGAVARVADAMPDVAVVGLHPRGLDGLEAVRAILRADPRTRVVVYARAETDGVYAALEAGASAFVLEQARSCDLMRVIREAHRRNGVHDEVKQKLEARGGRPSLTSREVEILGLLTQGLRTRAISATLHISDHTVKVYVKRAYSKLGVHGRAAAVTEALRRGVVRLASGRHAPFAAPAHIPPSHATRSTARTPALP